MLDSLLSSEEVVLRRVGFVPPLCALMKAKVKSHVTKPLPLAGLVPQATSWTARLENCVKCFADV